ncbi:MAG: lysylphosphatidylglycerol synthase transmembrane domain-containing protein [Pirellulaceae bacterium]
MKDQRLKKIVVACLKLGLPAALFVYLLWSVDEAEYAAFWQQPKRWDLLLAAQLVALSAIVVSFLRWRVLVLAFEIPFTLTESLRLGFLGYLLNFVSFGSVGGDVFKAILVARHKPEKRPEAVASVLVDRAIGLLGLVLLAWGSLALFSGSGLTPLLVGIRRGAGLLTLASVAALVTAVYAGRWFERFLDWVERLPWLGPSLARMARAVRLLRTRPITIPILLAMALAVHILLALTVYLVSHGIYTQSPSLKEHLMVVPPGMAAGALPLAPGGIGLQEGALAGLFEQLPNLPQNFSGMIVATVYRLITITIAGIGLAYYVASHGREFKLVRTAVS